ncbi:hypothetical protein ISS86_00700 [Candidatus Microgenomates bacterium]|nr:hypothetical protein [Candidatus Microgenomates bacterium]
MSAPIRASTQEFLEIEDIKDDLVVLKDGSCCLIIKTSAVNFGLLSQEEQDAIIFAYAAFLNSLSFPIQILISSRKMDISSYLDRLSKLEENQRSGKIRSQIRKYYQFILAVVKENKVLEKNFYLIIPFSSLELGVKSAATLFPSKKKLPFPKDYVLQRAKTALYPKRDHILRQLGRTGLKGEQLSSSKLIEFFYEAFNPQASREEKISEGGAFDAPLIEGVQKQ